MKTKMIMAILFVATTVASGQWAIDLGTGLSIPITGYSHVVETGANIFNLQANHQIKSGKVALGLNTQMTRFAKDKTDADQYYETKITVAPVVFTMQYTFNPTAKWQPYLEGGLGLSFFVVSYNNSATEVDDESIFNTNFTMMPALGLKYKVSEQFYPFFETGLVSLMDGPPVGFPEGYNVTGYVFVNVGAKYVFVK